MIVAKEGEQTIIDGAEHTTFIKIEKFDGHVCTLKKEIDHCTVQHFHWTCLMGNPVKDCWALLRWYFSQN